LRRCLSHRCVCRHCDIILYPNAGTRSFLLGYREPLATRSLPQNPASPPPSSTGRLMGIIPSHRGMLGVAIDKSRHGFCSERVRCLRLRCYIVIQQLIRKYNGQNPMTVISCKRIAFLASLSAILQQYGRAGFVPLSVRARGRKTCVIPSLSGSCRHNV
jgi:hypothetical protein